MKFFCILLLVIGLAVCNSSIAANQPEPELVWGTYFGGRANDYGSCVTTDSYGNIYFAGSTVSSNGIATNGAYQTVYNGSIYTNAFLAKFTSSGSLLWATYYGGNNGCAILGIVTDSYGNVYVTGEAEDANMATAGAYQTALSSAQNGENAFIAKFSPNGERIWSTYFGGNGRSYSSGIAIDSRENIYITGNADDSATIATIGAFQGSFGGGEEDAFLARFDTNGSLQWATFFGGSGIDYSSGISAAIDGNIYMTGYTSSNLGISSNGAFQISNNGSNDAFLAKFDPSGACKWATYFGGNGDDRSCEVATDGLNNVYITGSTTSHSNIATTGAFQTSIGVNGGCFLAKFNKEGNNLWSTYFSGNYGGEAPDGIAVDRYGNVFISGITASDSGIATGGAYQSTYNGGNFNLDYIEDKFLAMFNSQGEKDWATYFGKGEYTFSGNTLYSDANGYIYVSGTTRDSNITTQGAYQTSFGGGFWDAFLAKFSDKVNNEARIDYFIYPIINSCEGKFPVKVRLKNIGLHELDSVRISWSINGILQPSFAWAGKLQTDSTITVNLGNYIFSRGNDTLKAWIHNPNGFNDSSLVNDTSEEMIEVFPPPIASFNLSPNQYLIEKDKIIFNNQSSNASSWFWNFGNQDTSLQYSPAYSYNDSGMYKIELIAYGFKGCPNDTDTEIIDVNGDNTKIFIPDVFSPNGDKIDDVFGIFGFGIKSYSFDIYDRWGQHIYHGNADINIPVIGQGNLSPGARWDGTFNGMDSPVGTYVYQFDVVDIHGNHHKIKGLVNLLR